MRRLVVTLAVGCVVACHNPREAKAMETVKAELALLQPPAGMEPTETTPPGLGEMDASGAQTYCVPDEKAGQAALDAMLRKAGWTYQSTETRPDEMVWRYVKGQTLGSLALETQPQPCGRRFVVGIVESL